jgi:hypothetical protein
LRDGDVPASDPAQRSNVESTLASFRRNTGVDMAQSGDQTPRVAAVILPPAEAIALMRTRRKGD